MRISTQLLSILCLSLPVLGAAESNPSACHAPPVGEPAAERRASLRGERDEASQALDELRTKLASPQRRTRRSALRGLAKLDSLEAWGLLVGALADPAGEVADGAQRLLGALDRPEELELLLGRKGLHARSAWVRRRSVEILGRVALPVPIEELLLALRDRDAEVRRLAAWTLERRKQAGRWPAQLSPKTQRALVTKLRTCAGSDRVLSVRGRALRALALVDPPSAARLHPVLMKNRHLGLRCVALDLAPELLAEAEALELLARHARGDQRLLRDQAQESLARWGTRAALGELVECLPLERDPRLSFNLLRRLRALSGLRHRRDPRPWRAWLAELPEGWRAAPLGGEVSGDATPATRVPRAREEASVALSFAGLELRSSRLTFLIDLSGSMWTPSPDDRTAKQVVEQRLAQALESLPKETRFNVIPYTAEPHPWERTLMPATPRNKQEALRFFAKCKQRGSGNFWDAALLALEDPEVDTLVVLTDGAPSGGQRYELELIVSHFLELNLTRRVAVDSVLVDASTHLERHWRRLAEGTGGESISIAFP